MIILQSRNPIISLMMMLYLILWMMVLWSLKNRYSGMYRLCQPLTAQKSNTLLIQPIYEPVIFQPKEQRMFY